MCKLFLLFSPIRCSQNKSSTELVLYLHESHDSLEKSSFNENWGKIFLTVKLNPKTLEEKEHVSVSQVIILIIDYICLLVDYNSFMVVENGSQVMDRMGLVKKCEHKLMTVL